LKKLLVTGLYLGQQVVDEKCKFLFEKTTCYRFVFGATGGG
jgi:hypothetical protein